MAGDGGGGLALISEISIVRPLGRLLRVFRLSPVLDAFDKLLAHYRARLGRFISDGPAPRRYP